MPNRPTAVLGAFAPARSTARRRYARSDPDLLEMDVRSDGHQRSHQAPTSPGTTGRRASARSPRRSRSARRRRSMCRPVRTCPGPAPHLRGPPSSASRRSPSARVYFVAGTADADAPADSDPSRGPGFLRQGHPRRWATPKAEYAHSVAKRRHSRARSDRLRCCACATFKCVVVCVKLCKFGGAGVRLIMRLSGVAPSSVP